MKSPATRLVVTRFAVATGPVRPPATGASCACAQEIAIGVPVSLTGVYAFVGTAAVKGMQMAVDEINAASEAGPGRTLKLVVVDDGSNTNQTITLVNRLATLLGWRIEYVAGEDGFRTAELTGITNR